MKIMGVEKDRSDLSFEKDGLKDELHLRNIKIVDLEGNISNLNQKIAETKHELEHQTAKFEKTDKERLNLADQNSELK